MRVTEQDLDTLNARFQKASPLEILRFAHHTFGPRAALLCGMQRVGTLLCHLADQAGLALDVLFIDTGVMHAETLLTRDELARTHPNLRVITLSPERSFAEQTAAEGLLYVTPDGQERCCELRKTGPLRTVRTRYDALIAGLRADEGGARANVKPFGVDAAMNALRVHPLASQTRAQLEQLIAEHPGLVLNPLHAMGFPTIGCFPCTTPVREDEPERAGRWRHLSGVEYCRINPVDRGERGAVIDLDDRYAGLLA